MILEANCEKIMYVTGKLRPARSTGRHRVREFSAFTKARHPPERYRTGQVTGCCPYHRAPTRIGGVGAGIHPPAALLQQVFDGFAFFHEFIFGDFQLAFGVIAEFETENGFADSVALAADRERIHQVIANAIGVAF